MLPDYEITNALQSIAATKRLSLEPSHPCSWSLISPF
jgi:hypothetical protein